MFSVSVIVKSNCHILQFLHQMFNVDTLNIWCKSTLNIWCKNGLNVSFTSKADILLLNDAFMPVTLLPIQQSTICCNSLLQLTWIVHINMCIYCCPHHMHRVVCLRVCCSCDTYRTNNNSAESVHRKQHSNMTCNQPYISQITGHIIHNPAEKNCE